MTGGMIWALAAVVAGNAQAAPDVAVPLAPSGKWVVEHEDNVCVLSRTFGGGPGGAVSFGVKPLTLSKFVTVVVIAPVGIAKRANPADAARIVLSPSNQSIAVTADTHGVLPTGETVAMLSIDRSALPALLQATSLTIAAGDVAVAIAPTAGLGAAKALATCETQLTTRWGIDPVALAAVAIPAKENIPLHEMIGTDDYPKGSVATRKGGDSMLVWKIGTDGKVSECRAVQSAGDARLDAAGCNAITRRGTFTPARAVDGTAIASWRSTVMKWRNP